MAEIMGKAFPNVKKNLVRRSGNPFPKAGIRLPAMNQRKRTAMEVLVDNMVEIMKLPGNEDVSTGPALADKAKVDRKTVYNILEKRHIPKIDMVEKIARALKVDTFLLLMPVELKGFALVSKAYSASDERGREILLDLADSMIKKSERSKNSEAFRA
jgi:transcriptional regulator with XRE-family HTH domain